MIDETTTYPPTKHVMIPRVLADGSVDWLGPKVLASDDIRGLRKHIQEHEIYPDELPAHDHRAQLRRALELFLQETCKMNGKDNKTIPYEILILNEDGTVAEPTQVIVAKSEQHAIQKAAARYPDAVQADGTILARPWALA